MRWCRVCGVSTIVSSVLVSAGSALADPKGLWLAQDGAHARVGPCGAALCARLETRVGVRLLERTTRTMTLTDEGRRFYEEVGPHLDGIEQAATRASGSAVVTIAKPKSSVDPQTGLPWTDKNNPDPAHRGRPLIGVPVLDGLVPDGPGHWSGRLYNIDNGNSYAGHLLEIDPRTIRVEGCAIGICGGQNMTRIR